MKGGGKSDLGLRGNTISNEYDYSPSLINFHVESNHCLNSDGLNNAEIDAMNAEREREKMKRKQKEEFEKNMTQYKRNNSQYRLKKEKGKSLKKIHQLENEKKKLNQRVYNATIRKSNLNKIIDQKNKEQNDIKNSDDKLHSYLKMKNESVSKKGVKEEEKAKDLVIQTNNDKIEKVLLVTNNTKQDNSITIDLRTALDDILNQKLQSEKNKAIKSLLGKEEGKKAYQRISSNLKQLSMFRENGTFYTNKILQTTTSPKQKEQRDNEELSHRHLSNNEHNMNNQHQIHLSKLDKRRFNLALKNIFIEKLGERNIRVPSICNCGQLQKDLDTILYVKNNSVFSVFEPSCASNCLYYHKRNEYEKSINDILISIRNLKFESFNNKY